MHDQGYHPMRSVSLMLAALLVLALGATPSYSQDHAVSATEQSRLELAYEQAKEARFANPTAVTEQAFVEAQAALARARRSATPATPAGTTSYSGTTTGGPFFDRPFSFCSGTGGTRRYHAQPFFVDATGAYDITSVQTYDGYIHVYVDAFDPTDPGTNCIAGNDDDPFPGLSGILGLGLTAGTQYFLVTSAFSGDGDFDNTISGPGEIFLGILAGDLAVSKTVELDEPAKAGTYHIEITNNGPSDATGVEVTDFLPASLTVVGWSTFNGTPFDPDTGIWTVGDLAVGDNDFLWIDVTFDAVGRYTNRVEITAGAVADLDPDNNEAEVSVIVLDDRAVPDFVPEQSPGGVTERGNRFSADLRASKEVDVETAPVGGQVHYSVMVENLGPHSTAKVQATDHLPACLSDVTWTADRGTYDPDTGIWNIGKLKVDEKVTIEFWATVTAECTGTVTNEVWITRSGLPDPSSSFFLFDEPNPALENNHADASFDVESTNNARSLNGQTVALGRNYPNPFNPTTTIPFSLAEASAVTIRVYDLLGRTVATLVDGTLSAGVHEVRFEAARLPTGTYLVRMEAGSIVETQHITLMK